jgi:hypothetical protein
MVDVGLKRTEPLLFKFPFGLGGGGVNLTKHNECFSDTWVDSY